MTDRLKGLTVTLEADMREDDAKFIIDAILLLRGVAMVHTHVADLDHHFAVSAAKMDLQKKIIDLVKP